MRDFSQIAVWTKAHRFTLSVYEYCNSFPATERFGLARQITRAASSIGANIAEGCGRGGDGDLCRFLRIAIGSAFEAENHLLLARDLGYIGTDAHKKLETDVKEVQRMLASFIRKVQNDLHQHPANR